MYLFVFQPTPCVVAGMSEGAGDEEELDFQFDDYGGKTYNFSDPPTANHKSVLNMFFSQVLRSTAH